MAADASIYAQFRRPVRSMAEYAADYDVAEGNALKLAAARLDAQKAQRAMADEDAIRGLARQHGGDVNALVKAFRAGGYFDQAAGLEKSIDERLKAKSDQAKTEAETEAKRFEVAEKRSRAFEDARAALEADPGLSRDKVLGVLQGMVERDLMPLQLAQRMAQGLPDDPNLLRDDIRRGNLSRLSAKDRIELFTPKTEWKDGGQQLIPVQVNPNAPGYVAPTAIQKVQTPDSVARGEEAEKARQQQAREGALNRGNQLKIAGMADARMRDLASQRQSGGAAAKPMPAAALKMQDEDLNAIGTFAGLDKDIEGFEKQMADGKLDFGPVKNITGQARNYVGASSEQSRNLATFKSKLEGMRNAVLLLNKGVQTEGDAQRAMNELMANINDPEVVKQRLSEIRALNQRAVALKKNNIGILRRNYGQEDMDFSAYENAKPATNLGGGPSRVKSDADYDALPSGATFIGPDGKTRRKP